MASHYYLEGGLQLSGRSREQKLNNDAEWNEVPQGRTAGHMFARLEEEWSERGRSRVTSGLLVNTERGDLVEKSK